MELHRQTGTLAPSTAAEETRVRAQTLTVFNTERFEDSFNFLIYLQLYLATQKII